MSKLLTVFILIISSVLISSCGVKKNSKGELDRTNAYIEASIVSKSCGGESVDEIEKKILSLELNFSKVTVNSIRPKSSKTRGSKKADLSTIILSKAKINSEIEELQKVMESIEDISMNSDNYIETRRRILRLRANFNRWHFHQCHLPTLIDSNAQELNDFIELESMMCQEDCIETPLPYKEFSDSEKRRKAVNVCSLFERRNHCRVHYSIAELSGGEDLFIKDHLVKAREYFKNEVYGVTDTNLDIQCTRGDKIEITVPVKQNKNMVSFKSAITEYWKDSGLEIKFRESSSGVNIIEVEEGPSRVALNDLSTIYLNKNLAGVERVKTIAHEFGHTLGFKDCYIEYFDYRSEEIIYYELERDKGNLMCSLEKGTNIPKKYLEKIVSKYCH